ncbi:MAG TPA: oxidoreductase [Candidatus Brocadiia bacterium]|nr:FAD-dependent oxidoreductase [Candidatus Brocadiales bacterium]
MPLAGLLEPLKIGNYLLKNRITMSAMPTGFGHIDGNISMTMLNYYARRARGGASLIVVEGAAVDENGRSYPAQIMANHTFFISGLNKLAEAIKENGAVAVLQLNHGGRLSNVKHSRAPSAGTFECPVTGKKFSYSTMNAKEIESAIAAFVKAATSARDAGFDMIELGGGYGYLLSQFISPRTNNRSDRYGGNMEGRMSFAIEIIEKTREALGEDYPIGYQMMADELMPGGFAINDAQVFAKRLVEKGVSYLTITSGTPESFLLNDGLFAMRSPEGSTVSLAASIKKELEHSGKSCPVFVSGKITDPKLCEEIVSSGQADGVALDRALFCEPELPLKIKAKQYDEIIECVSCANCADRVLKGLSADCTINPTVGREGANESTSGGQIASSKKKILVGGSGPAGIFAALAIAKRGHEVTLLEKAPKLGGHLKAAPKAPGKTSWNKFLELLERSVKKSSIKLKLECELNEDAVKNNNTDVVIVATGVKLKKLTAPISGGREVLSPGQILFGSKEGGKNNVVIGAGLVGCEIAEFLAEKGKFATANLPQARHVTIVERLSYPAGEMDAINRAILLQKLNMYGVKIYLNASVKEITATKVIITNCDGKEVALEADVVINATGFDPNNDVFFKIKDMVKDVHIIGDAKKPSNIHDAVHEGYQLGLNL